MLNYIINRTEAGNESEKTCRGSKDAAPTLGRNPCFPFSSVKGVL
jgi:hypothetical protein